MISLYSWTYSLSNLLALSEDDAKSLIIDYHYELEGAKARIYELEETLDGMTYDHGGMPLV